ncbi:efflux RND transporter periplasmic adaptor subunit [Vibrio ruber]|uniref:Multidrug resistance protein MdtA n=1 Tax=Vibrio ruber (strain DSM 16370 / JCM 11486 / BCRC 17186 / CECT 7878 / LMG 23124 / VR1) TaxID=1123498 RepID=A0A1R4LLM7_VIBR1|nr:efflux RND transporter periplasmic adaptor subunit [Vibrio ruber]WNJ96606.1 efflux RND transporter periplasmic adaptor subunit [Vibrio ruber]SJN57154.1 Multidrug resistance protein MdtA precursor [Vibrio ruber DSM 16370]
MKKRTLLWTFSMLLIVIVLLGSVIGINLFKQKAMNDYFANMPEPSFPITVSQIKVQDWTPVIEAIGFIEPKQGVTLTSETSGVIKDITFESGAFVEKGQMLMTLDSAVEKANLKSAQARLPAAKAKYERYRGLYTKGSLSQESFDEAEAAYFSLSADIESLKATIARREIKAPFSGSVGIRNIYVGQYLNIGSDIVRLEDTSVMRLHFTIPQTDLSKISVGQTVDISVDAYPDDFFKGTIKAIEPAVNAQSGLVQVEANIPNSDGKLRSGMFAKANILLPVQKDQVIIPQVAIAYTLYGDSVYVVTDKDGEKRVKQKVIKVGERKKDVAHILSGVKDGDVIVTSGQVRLSNGAKVHVVESDTLTPSSEVPML